MKSVSTVRLESRLYVVFMACMTIACEQKQIDGPNINSLGGSTSYQGKSDVNSPEKEKKSSSPNVTYDPDTCKEDAGGMAYLAVGRDVFRIPATQNMKIRGMTKKEREKLPPRPDPSEPEGCPGNPVWGRGFSIAYKHTPKHPENYPEDVTFRAESISIAKRFDSKINHLQLSGEEMFVRTKNNFNECELLAVGLEGCRIPTKDKSIPRVEWGVFYRAKPDVYSVPFDRPFIVSCYPYSNGWQPCYVAYGYSEESKLLYKFWLEKIPVEEIIEFDKGLREKIESVHVKEFLWPDTVNCGLAQFQGEELCQ